MKLAETSYDNSETGCCARLDISQWDGQEHVWKDQLFLRDQVRSFFHIPLNFGAVMTRDHEAIEAAAAYPAQPLWLTDEVSPWRSEVYVAVDRPVPQQKVESRSGRYLSKVFEGPYRHAPKWASEMKEYARSKGYKPKKTLYYYATCPKCAKRFGKNEIVLFTEVSAPKSSEPSDSPETSARPTL